VVRSGTGSSWARHGRRKISERLRINWNDCRYEIARGRGNSYWWVKADANSWQTNGLMTAGSPLIGRGGLVVSILFDVSAPELSHARIGLKDEHGTMLGSECLGGFQSVRASA
jgi:hypothetical protein